MIEFLKRYKKKTIDIYELAFEYHKKAVLQWSLEEINYFVKELDSLNEREIIQIKRSSKGEVNLDLIQKKIKINKWNLMKDANEDLNVELFIHGLGINGSYYLKNLKEYHQDKKYIDNIVKFLSQNNGQLTLNEISYLIFKDEKALGQPQKASINGRKVLSNLKLDINDIPYVDTIAPFYYPTQFQGDTVLIVENKDTCYSLLRILSKRETNIKGVLFGGGRAITKIFKFLYVYGLSDEDVFLYYGDIDQEGFDIGRSLIERFPDYNIKLSRLLYNSLLGFKGRDLVNKRMIDNSKSEDILEDLYPEDKKLVLSILESDRCIPQEALNYEDMKVIIYGLQDRLF